MCMRKASSNIYLILQIKINSMYITDLSIKSITIKISEEKPKRIFMTVGYTKFIGQSMRSTNNPIKTGRKLKRYVTK